MKVTVIPAQITTVEDRIAGHLGVSQLLLLAAPLFSGSALYIILPPSMHSAPYKLILLVTLMSICGCMAIRIKDKLVLYWIAILCRYRFRPRYYLFTLNYPARNQHLIVNRSVTDLSRTDAPALKPTISVLTTLERRQVEAIIDNPASNLNFRFTRKGVLHAFITETEA